MTNQLPSLVELYYTLLNYEKVLNDIKKLNKNNKN